MACYEAQEFGNHQVDPASLEASALESSRYRFQSTSESLDCHLGEPIGEFVELGLPKRLESSSLYLGSITQDEKTPVPPILY